MMMVVLAVQQRQKQLGRVAVAVAVVVVRMGHLLSCVFFLSFCMACVFSRLEYHEPPKA